MIPDTIPGHHYGSKMSMNVWKLIDTDMSQPISETQDMNLPLYRPLYIRTNQTRLRINLQVPINICTTTLVTIKCVDLVVYLLFCQWIIDEERRRKLDEIITSTKLKMSFNLKQDIR
jgi:hypothetical protein